MIHSRYIKEIKKLGIKIDHDMAFDGKSKGNKHLFRVVRLAKYLAKKLQADLDIVECGAWLHDTALPSGNDYNYKKNKKIVMKLLTFIDISKKEKDFIAECVASHEGTEKPKTLEAKIVHDADVLEKSGILGIIRHTWKLTNSGKIKPEKILDKDIQTIINHIKWRGNKLETPLARKIKKYLTIKIAKSKVKEIVEKTSKMASRGIITEKIVITAVIFLFLKK